MPVPRSGAGEREGTRTAICGKATSINSLLTRKASKGFPATRCRSAACRAAAWPLVQGSPARRAAGVWRRKQRPSGLGHRLPCGCGLRGERVIPQENRASSTRAALIKRLVRAYAGTRQNSFASTTHVELSSELITNDQQKKVSMLMANTLIFNLGT